MGVTESLETESERLNVGYWQESGISYLCRRPFQYNDWCSCILVTSWLPMTKHILAVMVHLKCPRR